jgi:Kef-type K+ transport system membrane component KefB
MLDLFTLFLQVSIVLLAGRAGGLVFRRFGQPQVVGEMAAGILLGPSLFGWLAPQTSAFLFPPASLPYLSALSQVGLVLFMFLVGLELDPRELRGLGHTAMLTSNASVVAPFCLGSLLALYLYPRLSDSSVQFLHFMLFMGAAMSITAFPVLARILAEHHLQRTRVGAIAIACAAANDVTGWCILAYIVFLIRQAAAGTPFWVTLAAILFYVLVMIFAIRPLLRFFERAYLRAGARVSDNAMAAIIFLTLASALCTELLGIHLLFGAFLMGVIMPKEHAFVHEVTTKLHSVTVVILLPLFFAYAGLRTRIGVGGDSEWWLYAALVIAVAIAGKLLGATLAARYIGLPWREAGTIGVLMNTRGLMELVILDIGFQIGVISEGLFSMMVLMALVTTCMTTPLLNWIYRHGIPGTVEEEQPSADPEPTAA